MLRDIELQVVASVSCWSVPFSVKSTVLNFNAEILSARRSLAANTIGKACISILACYPAHHTDKKKI
jgi:hypothetical protein